MQSTHATTTCMSSKAAASVIPCDVMLRMVSAKLCEESTDDITIDACLAAMVWMTGVKDEIMWLKSLTQVVPAEKLVTFNVDKIKIFETMWDLLIENDDCDKRTLRDLALVDAVRRGDTERFDFLIDCRGELDEAFAHACRSGRTYMAEKLFGYGAFPAPITLISAAEMGHSEIVKLLIHKVGFCNEALQSAIDVVGDNDAIRGLLEAEMS